MYFSDFSMPCTASTMTLTALTRVCRTFVARLVQKISTTTLYRRRTCDHGGTSRHRNRPKTIGTVNIGRHRAGTRFGLSDSFGHFPIAE